MAAASRRTLEALTALAVVVLGVPAVLSVSAFLQDRPVRLDEPSPRTVVAPDTIRVTDPEATERARREAAEAVDPVVDDDDEAKAAIVQAVDDAFARAEAVRDVDTDGDAPSRAEQREELAERLPDLGDQGLDLLVDLSEAELGRVHTEAVQVARQLARQRITEDRLGDVADDQLQTELAVRPLPDGAAETVVEPIVRDALRPTVRVDEEETATRREEAANEVADVERTFFPGSVIVSAGETVDEVQLAALRRRGLEGSAPWNELAKGAALVVVLVASVAGYLRAYRREVWRSPRRLLLLACLLLLFAVALEAATIATADTNPVWLYALPVGAFAMLATILFDPPVGVLAAVPATVLVAYQTAADPGVSTFAALASLASVPLVSRLSARGDLRRAAWQSTLAYVVLAGTLAGVFDDPQAAPTAMLAGLANGVLTAVILNGSLPFLESLFGVLTATSLLDLADRNHPLLRELEQKALGSYNHSIMVSTLVERAARRVGADSLLGSVAALYHDIGKVAKPYFFIENQSGMSNPHEDLDPAVSAVIIQNHVPDGLGMARTHRLPPEVAEGIATHHGTTVVGYFYRKAVSAAGGEGDVDAAHYRYEGPKPASKEMAILMLADSCEGASRAAALNDRNLTRDDLEGIVRGLVADRVDDGQLDESSLTFRELAAVQDSFIETLVGLYHPRIAYPMDTPGDVATEPASS